MAKMSRSRVEECESSGRTKLPKSTVTVRMPDTVLKQIDAMANRRGSDRTPILVELLERGLAAVNLSDLTSHSMDQISAAAFSLNHLQASIDDLHSKIDKFQKT